MTNRPLTTIAAVGGMSAGLASTVVEMVRGGSMLPGMTLVFVCICLMEILEMRDD